MHSSPLPPVVSPAIAALLALPEISAPPSRRHPVQEALINYSQSLLLTSEEYVVAMEEKGRRREEARVQTEVHREQAQQRRIVKDQERARKEKERGQREVEKESRMAFKARWTKEAIRQAGERLQDLVKNPPPRVAGDYIAPYLGNLLPIYKSNMALRLAKRRSTSSPQRNTACVGA